MITIKRVVNKTKLWGYFSNVQRRELTIFTKYEGQRLGNIPKEWNTPFHHALCILHEQGHIYCNHPPRNLVFNQIEVIFKEIEAWTYALNCIKGELILKALPFITYCLSTFNRRAVKKYGVGLTIDEVGLLLEAGCIVTHYEIKLKEIQNAKKI